MRDNRAKKAIALQYDPTLPAPMLIGKGKGEIAQRLIEIAESYGIVILEEPDLADILTDEDIGTCIPEDVFSIVAEIMAFVYEIRGLK